MNENVPSTQTPSKYLRIAYPMIFVTDVARAVAFYEDKLGFKVDYLYGEPAFYGMATRDGASFHFRHVDQSPINRIDADLLAMVIPVAGVRELFLELKEKAVEFHQSLKIQPWGVTDFIVGDPDGNLFCFSGEVEKG